MRVKLINVRNGKEIETVAIVNTGYESLESEITLPKKAAEVLGLYPLPADTQLVSYQTMGGEIRMVRIPKIIKVKLENVEALAFATISEVEREVVINDMLSGELGIIIENAGKGLWRIRGEARVRKSENPEYW